MADIQVKDSGKGGKRAKKSSGKPDMTPMVDLGFLLITFFMFTTTFSKPNSMKLDLPDKPDPNVPLPDIKISNTITILLGKDNRIFYHQQEFKNLNLENLVETNYSADGIRNDITKLKSVAADSSKFTVILKPTDDCNYKNTVDMLDEIAISGNRSAIVKVDPAEKKVYGEKILTSKPN
jgi:biopolymer transport protein ExbD